MAVWFVGVVGLRLCWTSFFDNFTMLSRHWSASLEVESLFGTLGIQFAKEGKKSFEWATQIETLGVQLDLRPVQSHGYVLLGRTESRVAELMDQVGAGPNDKQRCRTT